MVQVDAGTFLETWLPEDDFLFMCLPVPLDSMRWYCPVFRFSLPLCASLCHTQEPSEEWALWKKTVLQDRSGGRRGEKKLLFCCGSSGRSPVGFFLFRHWTSFYDECRVTEGGWKLLECITRHPLIAKWSGLKNLSNPEPCWCPFLSFTWFHSMMSWAMSREDNNSSGIRPHGSSWKTKCLGIGVTFFAKTSALAKCWMSSGYMIYDYTCRYFIGILSTDGVKANSSFLLEVFCWWP